MYTAAVIGDTQIPYHDPRAFDVCGQILSDAKLDMLIYNGDWADFRAISRYPQRNKDPRLFSELRAEILTAKERLATFHKSVKPKKAKFTSGNHEWRIERVFTSDPKVTQVLDIAEVGEAVSIESLFEMKKLGIKFIGQYPKGCWLHDGLEPERNVWIEHGMGARKEAGYWITNLMRDRWASVVVNHCEKLAIVWKRALGKSYFGIENGNLSIIAEPGKGDDIYTGIPHSTPEYINHRQGFSLLYYDNGQWFPQTIPIHKGRAVFAGKLYKS